MHLKNIFKKLLDHHKHEEKLVCAQSYTSSECTTTPASTGVYSLSYLEQIDQRIAQLRAQQYQSQQMQSPIEQQIASLEAEANCFRQQMNQKNQCQSQSQNQNIGQKQSQYECEKQFNNSNNTCNQNPAEGKTKYPKHSVFMVNKHNGHVNLFNSRKFTKEAIKNGIEGIIGTELHNFGVKRNMKLIKKIGKGMELLGIFKRNMAVTESYSASKGSFAVPAKRVARSSN